MLTAGVYTGASKPITAVSDGKNAWTKAGVYTVAGQNSDGELWYAPNAAPVHSVTVTTTAAVALNLLEFGGVATASPLDGSLGAAAKSTSASSGSVTPSTTNDLAIGFVAGHASTQLISVQSPGYTVGSEQITSGSSAVTVVSGFGTLSSAAAQTFSATFPTSMYWSAGIALFKAAAPIINNDFTIAASPTSVTITAGQQGTTTITTNITSGNAQTVALTATGTTAGTTLTFAPTSVTAGQGSTLTITTTTAAPAGTYPITITGTGPSATHTTTVSLTIASGSTPHLVQAVGATETAAATSLAVTMPVATTAGDLLVLSAGVYTGATNNLLSVTDSAGNLWKKIGAWNTASHNSDGEMWYAANALAATSVTVHLNLAATVAFDVQEFAGIATTNPWDVSTGASTTSTTVSSGALPTSAGELVVGLVAGHANAQSMSVTPAGYVVQPEQISTGTVTTVETGYQVVSAASSVSFGATFPAAMYWSAGVAAFRPAS